MQWLANISVRRPIFASVLMLLLVVIGFAGYGQLGVDRFPKVDFPTVVVQAQLPGAAPEEMETDVATKIEESVNTLAGIDELRSISAEGTVTVIVTFVLEKDIDAATQEVRDKVNAVLPELPAGMDPPVIAKFDSDATPVLFLTVHADRSTREITEVADKQIRPQLENVRGVGQLTILGGEKRQVNIWLDPIKLRAFQLTASEVQRAIVGQNSTLPGGRLDNGPEQLTLRIHGRVSDPAELGEVVVRMADDHPIRVRDVARIEDGGVERDSAATQSGQAAVVLSLRKQSGANTVATVDAVRERVEDLKSVLPKGYSLEVVRDNSATIRTSVDAVKEHLLLGALFAALVVLVFLGNLRSTVIAALAIPISIIGTFALMWIEGFTLDTITLLALALAVGIVIDDAIVVLENIFRHIEEKGMKPMVAAILATKEIGLAVLATTLSLMAVFLPVAFMSGIVGRFLKSFGLTMSFSILVSLLVSFTLTPMLSARWLKEKRPMREGGGAPEKTLLERLVDRAYLPLERLYVRVLGWVMAHRWVVVAASALALVSIGPLMQVTPKGFLPKSDEAQFEVNVRAPEGTSLEETALIGERVARQIREALPEVETTMMTVAGDTSRTRNRANVYVKLVRPEARKLSQEELMERVRREVLPHQRPDLSVDVSEVALFQGGGSSAVIQYEVSGPDLAALESYSKEIMEALKATPGAVDVSTSLVGGKPELGVSILRERAAALGVDVLDVANTLRVFVAGGKVSSYEEAAERYDVSLRAEPGFRMDRESLALLSVPSRRGGSVPLLDVVKLEEGKGPANINRLNRRRQVLVTANVAPGYAEGAALSAIEAKVQALKLPPEYHAGPAGRSREMARTGKAFALAFGLAFIFMYLILAAQLESWLHPLTILLALPLTLPFALISVIAFKQQLDIYSMLGILVLFGVVKKNSILQIDHMNALRKQGRARLEAIIEGNRDRLRPILMTTLAFVAGMLPLAFATGIGAGFNRATAGVIVGGQSLSLVLTLLATPVAYSLLDDLSAAVRRRLGRKEETMTEVELDRLLAEAGQQH
ncbi:MAG: efflux RND transporter permease subunit [Myxococcota bacterium]